MDHQAPLPNRALPVMTPPPQETGEVPMRNGKPEEGEAHGEGWAAARSMLLILAVVTVIAAIFYFGVYQH